LARLSVAPGFAAGWSVLAAVLVCLVGCGKGAPTGDVSGKVTFKNNPVAEGTVSFMNPAGGTGGEGQLKDGNYTLTAPLPVGEYKVMVTPPIVRKQDGGKGPEVGVELPAPDIPKKFRTIGTTTLKATVKEGKNEINLDMTP